MEGVTTDMASNKLTVIGKVDAWKLRDRVEAKTRKKVEIVSPVNPPKKDADAGKKPAAATGGGGGDSKEKKSPDDKKPKEPAASTVVLKIRLHCDGCIRRIKKTILKTKGVQDVTVDAQKDLVTVKGTIDVNSLPSYLKEKLNRGVEVVQTKSDAAAGGGGGEKKDKPAAAAAPAGGGEKKEKSETGGGEKKDKGGNGGGEKKDKAVNGGGGGGGGEKKEKGGGGDAEKKKEDGGGGGGGGGKKEAPAAAAPAVLEANKMDYYGGSYGYGYKMEMLHAPQIFSDENPNACSIM